MIKQRRNVFLLTTACFVVLAAGVGLYGLVASSRTLYRDVDTLKKTTRLAIVLPDPLPQGTTVADQPSYNQAANGVITRLMVSGKSITLTQQKRPDTDLDQIDAQDTFLVSAGSVYVLKGEAGRLQAIVETSDSWLMVNADAGIGSKLFKEILDSLDTI